MSHQLLGRAVMITAATAFTTGLFTGVANATAPMTTINSATASGGNVTVSVTYTCDPSSGAVQLTVVVSDKTSGAYGAGSATPTCNSQNHTVNVLVKPSGFGGLTFHSGDSAGISTDLLDTDGNSIGNFTLG
ncbi:hypothetical protein [Nocardia sp. NPDC059228]|uniref:hypothetical protein n=1 Tax=Nocardia sp. NPDC059228 TaxID=3346777 RepID=UPI0036AF22D3